MLGQDRLLKLQTNTYFEMPTFLLISHQQK